jgi:hypothetical protein
LDMNCKLELGTGIYFYKHYEVFSVPRFDWCVSSSRIRRGSAYLRLTDSTKIS